MNGGYSGLKRESLQRGEIVTDGIRMPYCAKRCACIVGWQVFLLILLAVGGVYLQIMLI